MIDERNASELGAELAPRGENQMKVKHIAYGLKLWPQTRGTASRRHLDRRNPSFFAHHTKERSPIALAFTSLETTSIHQHPITYGAPGSYSDVQLGHPTSALCFPRSPCV